MITDSNLTICACWLIYIVYWIGSARRLKRVVKRQSWLSIIAHRIPVMLGGFLLVAPRLSPLLRHSMHASDGSRCCNFRLEGARFS